MGFRTGAFAKVWEVTPMSDTSTKLRMSISRKNKKTDEYEQDFSGFVLAIGTAAASKAARLKEGDRIKLGEGDAFDSYQELGRFVDMVKNQICGEMNIAGIGAAQATVTGKLADSAKIARNASTIAMITDKTPEEIEADGAECGNKKLRVTVNRNGMQMTQDEYIDLLFDGNHIRYEQAKQHIPQTPFD